MGLTDWLGTEIFAVLANITGVAAAATVAPTSAPVVRLLAGRGRLPALTAARLQRVVVVGDGGTGKSTILKQMLASAGTQGRIPVWVSLSALPADGVLTPASLVEHLVQQAREVLGLQDVNEAFFHALVAEGRLAIGFDALDECGALARRQKVRALIAEVARTWGGCQVFVTSRPDALRETPLAPLRAGDDPPAADAFWAFEPVPFVRDDVASFLKAAFDDDGSLANQLLGRTGVEALLETPLTLTLVGLVARTAKDGQLPLTRTPLFRSCVKTVCETWEDAKGGRLADGLDAEQRLDVLRRIGWEAQQADDNVVAARAAGRALAAVPAFKDRAEGIVNGLARRNLLLRAEAAETGEVRQIRFAHPQFREYLAGAHLAARLDLDEAAALAAIAPHWFDVGWLEVLRFAVATIEDDPPLRDALLEAILAADDPYRDLLRRPEFLVARLAARLPQADAALIGQVAQGLERAALDEPGLRDEAARLLLGLAHHPAAAAPLRRFAKGQGAAAAYPPDEVVAWRLLAIEASSRIPGTNEALALLDALPQPGLEAWALRLRLGDRAGALAGWQRMFDQGARDPVAAAMDGAGAGAQFDAWLAAAVARPSARIADVQLARRRQVAVDLEALWTGLFEDAAKQFEGLPPDEDFAPPDAADAVYAAIAEDGLDGRAGAAQRTLLTAALRHRAMTWYVGANLGDRYPDLRPEIVDRLKQYVLAAGASTGRADHSRLNGVVHALSRESNDALAVPALRELLRTQQVGSPWIGMVVTSLAARGRAAEVLADLEPLLRLPDGVTDRQVDGRSDRRASAWRLAQRADWPRTRALLDALYRAGDPQAGAQRLMDAWSVSGVGAVARAWFDELAADEDGRAWLRCFAAHGRDCFFTDAARQALHGGVLEERAAEPERPPADPRSDFERALATGTLVDEDGDERDATSGAMLRLLDRLRLEGGQDAEALADDWMRRTLADTSREPGEQAELLEDLLRGLSGRGLYRAEWLAPVVDRARAMTPAQRESLVFWLAASV